MTDKATLAALGSTEGLGADSIARRLCRAFEMQLGLPSGRVVPTQGLVTGLGFDSLDCVDALMAVEDEFDLVIEDEDAAQCVTVADCIVLVERLVKTDACAASA